MSNLDTLWTAIKSHVEAIKELPNDVIVGLIDSYTEYGRIDPDSIKHDDKHVWVQLNRITKVTLFEKSDYEEINKNDDLDASLIAQNKITEVFSFSKAIEPKSLFKNWH